MYAKPQGDIIRRHGLSYHFYADDTQLYISFNPKEDTVEAQSLSLIDMMIFYLPSKEDT
jgi:hypothetical protein